MLLGGRVAAGFLQEAVLSGWVYINMKTPNCLNQQAKVVFLQGSVQLHVTWWEGKFRSQQAPILRFPARRLYGPTTSGACATRLHSVV